MNDSFVSVVRNVRGGGCHSSVAKHWLHKPDVLGLIPGDCWPFHFLYFCLITFLSRMRQDDPFSV